MAKTYLSTVKYVVKTGFTIDGIVDKHDIIGAIFGQSEGLIGEEMDLKELQKNGKLGRIEVETKTKTGKTVGTLTIPSGLDKVQTSILAAAIESVDKVGPCNSSFKTTSIEDARQEKRKAVTERAKELLLRMGADMPETQELTEQIREKARASGIREIGREKISIGPEVDSSQELILVEGRADVINLLKHGIKNVAGIGGAKVSRTIINLARGKEVTIFVDGDRGGDLIVRQLSQAMKIDFVAKAPDGKEVEELTLKEILSSLRKKEETGHALRFTRPVSAGAGRRAPFPRREEEPARADHRRPADYNPGEQGYDRPRSQGYRPRTGSRPRPGFGRPGSRPRPGFGRPGSRPSQGYRPRTGGRPARPFPRESAARRPMPIKPNDLGKFSQAMKELEGSLKARFLDEKTKTVKEVNVRELLKEMAKHKNANAIVLDGIVTKRLLAEAEKNNVKQLVGVKKGRIEETGKVKVETLY